MMESHNANTSSNLSIRPCLPSPRSQHHPAFLENRAIRGRGEVNCEYRSQLLYSYASFLFLSYCYCLHFCLMPTSLPPKQIGRERLERYPRSLNQPLIIITLNFSLSPCFRCSARTVNVLSTFLLHLLRSLCHLWDVCIVLYISVWGCPFACLLYGYIGIGRNPLL